MAPEWVPASKKTRWQDACLIESFVCFLSIFANSIACHDIATPTVQEIHSFCKLCDHF